MSLTSCLKEATALSAANRAAVMKRAAELRAEGLAAGQAGLQAATELRDSVAAELASAEEAGQLLQAQTAADLQAKVDREQAGMDAERRQRDADQARLRREAEDRDNRARADQTVDDFQLGQSAEQQMSGMGDLFGGDPGTMFDGEVTEDPQTKEITYDDRARDDWADSYGLTVDDFVVAIRAAAESVPSGSGAANEKLGHISTLATMPKAREGISQADFVELQADKTDKLRAEADRADKKFEADLAEQADGTLEPMLANLRKYAEHPVRVQRILAKYRSVGGSQARQANEVHVMARAYWKRGRFAEIGQLLRQSARNKTAFGNAYSHDGGWKWDDVNEQLERSLDKAGTSALNALGPRRGADVLAALGYREDGKYSLRERADAMKDAAAKRKALDDLNDALGDLGDILGKNVRKNLTPEQEQKLLPVLTRVMDAAFRAGYYSFRQAARFVLDKIRAALGDDAADAITLDHLQGAYIGMAGRYRDDPEFADRQPDAKRAVIDIESKEELENGDAPAPGNDLERSGGPGLTAGDENLRGAVPAGSAAARPGAGQPDAAAGAVGDGPDGAARLADGDAAADGERGNQPRRRGRAGAAPGAARGGDGERSAPAGDARVQPAAPAGEETADADSHAAAVARRVAAQKLAGSKPITFADKANIDETLPLLLPEQRDDVLKAEQRFAAGHVGILFTNGTGTGKTFTGLGVVKRMHQAGKRNILILAPDDKIIGDWIRSAKMIGLDIGQLESTKDAGKGVVITTYANAGMNLSLADRDWDAVVADESHNLSSNKDGDLTAAAHTLNAITLHPDGVYTRAAMIHRELNGEITRLNAEAKSARASDDEREWARAAQLEARLNKLSREYEAKRDAIKADVQARQGQRPRAVFLSATPFAWVPNLNYANGYLFDWNEGQTGDDSSGYATARGYNGGTNRERFYMQHFGYRMRYNRLTRPEAGVDVALMERQFNTYLKRTGALSGRQLEVGPDYDRRFIAVESTLGRRIDEALAWDREDGFDYTTATEAEKSQRRADDEIRDKLRKAFAFQQRQYFLEAIKARALVPYIQAQLDAGRKVVVFHDFKKGGVTQNPFSRQVVMGQGRPNETDKDAYDRWAARFPDLAGLDIAGMGSPIEVLSEAFGDRLSLFNGDIKAKDRETAVARFNDDAEGPRVILVQSAKAAGWSGHDTTGKHQRVLINLGMPTRPFTAIQQEGRIYRTGQASDAMQRYASTGTSWERTAFAEKLAERAETAENLAMGESARALKQAFIDAYENADDYPPGHEGEGKGGKEADRASNAVVSAFDLAKTAYWAQQKRTQRNKSREGTDYFATPEPIGLKLVEWLDLRAGETGMEPSAGHGAIARWFPEHIPTVAVEPSDELRSRLGLVFNGNHARVRDGRFEDLDVGANKADGVAMNPPFGLGGSMAIPHLAKAVKHLRDGGRVAAIIPRGGMADKRLDAFLETEDGQALRWVADITMPGVTFNRAGAGVVARIVVFDKGIDPDGQAITRDFTSIEDINELFERLENMDVPRRGKPMPTAEELIAATRTADAPPTREERAAIREVQKAEKEGRKATGADLAAQLGLELVDYTTSKGKLIKGVLRSDLTKDQVAQFSSAPFWMRDRRAWFIRDHELAKAHELFPFKGKPAADDDVRFSLAAEQTEPFYSELARQVEGVAMRAAPASGWLQWLKGLPAKGVKPDEIEWSGLPEWLELQAGKITREQVVEYLRANGVRVTETVLSDEAAQRLPAGWQVRPSNADDDANYEWVLVDDQGEIRGEGETEREAMEDGWDPDVAADGNSKYGQYTLPGGTNYREVLLTLPGAKPTMRKQWAAWDGDELVSVSPNGPGRDWAARGWRIEERMVPDKQASERAGQYQSAHWDQPNVLAHIRLNDRTTVEPLTAQQEEDNRKRAALQARADELGKKIGKAARDSRIAGDIRREELLAKLRPLVRAGQMSPVEMTRQLDDAAFAEAGPEVVAMTKERDAILKSMPAEHKPRTAHVLFVEEIQSDWAQQGKKTGFKSEAEKRRLTSELERIRAEKAAVQRGEQGTGPAAVEKVNALQRQEFDLIDEYNRKINDGVPSAPFVDKTDKWVALALKRIVKMAVDEGYDKVAFVNGEQSAERYDLSKQIEEVEWLTRPVSRKGANAEPPTSGRLLATAPGGQNVMDEEIEAAKLPDYIGKELADRLLSAPAKPHSNGRNDVRVLSGLQLKVGGEGMRAFYDKIVPAALKDVLRKTGGGKVETVEIGSAIDLEGVTRRAFAGAPFAALTEEAQAWVRDKASKEGPPRLTQPGFTITPAMREKAAGGMPLFRLVDAVDRPDTGVDTAAYGRTSPEDRAAIRAAESRFRAARPDLQLDAVPARAGAETGQPLRGADRARVAAAELARRMFDKRVVFFRSNTPFANGFFRPADDGRIFLNADSRVPHMAVLGHELLHAMRRDRPDLYDMLKARVMAVSRDTGQKDLLLQLNREKAGLPKLDQDILDEEFIADVVGDRFMEPEFWAAMAKDQPGAFQRVVAAVRRFLDDVIQALTQVRPFNTNAYLADVRAARDAVAEAMRQYSGGEVGAMTGATDNDILLSPTRVRDGRIRRTIDELVESTIENASWRDWYDMHTETVRRLFGEDAELFQRILSATSQLQTVKGNVTMALRAYEAMLTGAPFQGLPSVRANLERIRRQQGLNGPKISEFERGNLGAEDAIAVDRHIAQLLFNTSTPNAKQIESAKVRIRKIAQRLGWTPKQAQAALWAANQVRKGTDIESVVSYDRILEQRADAIEAIRAKYGRGGGDATGSQADPRAGQAGAQGTDDEIRFSLSSEPGLGNQALRDFLKATRTGTSNRFNALHKTISTQLHKARTNPDFARVFNIAQDYEQDVSRAASRPAQAAPDVLPAHDNLRSAFSSVLHGDRDKAVLDKVGRALFAGTLENGPEPDNGVIWSAAALRERFGLDDRGIELYRQARKAIGASLDETAAALAYQMVKKFAPQLRGAVRRRPDQARVMIETVLEPMADGDPAIAEALADAMAVFDRAAELKAGGYAPLMRFGRYAVDVVGEDGERLHFERFDTELQAKMAEQRLAREYPGATVERSTMSDEAYKLFAGVDPETVALFAQQLGNRIDGTALQEWYRKAVSDRSAMKRMIGPRKGMAGYSPDLQRVLASFITSNARLSARQMNMGDMAAQIADMQERRVAGDVVDEAIRLRDYLDNPDEPFKGLRSLMFTWYLGGSVASAAVNLTQPLMMTWPYLSQFGGAASALTNAVREAITGKVADTELAKAMQRAADEGKVDPQEVHHLYREGMSTMIDRLPTGNDLKARAQGFSTMWGAFFGAAENFNRRITFIAAYRMAKADATLGDPYKFAIRAIDETQGIYNKSNRPNWARGTGSFGALGVAAFTFKQYSIAYVELLVRMAKSGPQGKRAALAMLGMLVLASGLQGLPGMEDLEDLIDTAAQMMGMRGNSQAALRESLVDAFGSSVADAIMYGPASGLPFDITSRMGLGDLLPSTGILKPSNERRRGQELAEILGPMGGFASQVGDFTTALDSGAGLGKAIGAFSPLAVKNALMGMHMMEDGYYSDTAGRRVTDTSDLDAGFKFIGFQPQSVASVRRPERLVAQDISRVKGVEADIVRLRAEAIVERDQAKRDRAAAMLRDWNQANPELRIRIKDSQVVQRVKQMRRTSGERILNTAPRETRRALAETL